MGTTLEWGILMSKRLYTVRPINDLKDMLSQSVSLYGDRTAYKIKKQMENASISHIVNSAKISQRLELPYRI